MFPAGTTNCSGTPPGGEAAYTEADDLNQNSLDAGQGLSGLPGSILQMTGNPLQVINPAALPVNPVISDGLTGGYLPGGKVPGPLLVRALNYINTEVGAMVAQIDAQGLADSTALRSGT